MPILQTKHWGPEKLGHGFTAERCQTQVWPQLSLTPIPHLLGGKAGGQWSAAKIVGVLCQLLRCVWRCDATDCSPPGSSVPGILQARILEWVAFPFSRGSSQPRDQTQVSCIAGDSLPAELSRKPLWVPRETLNYLREKKVLLQSMCLFLQYEDFHQANFKGPIVYKLTYNIFWIFNTIMSWYEVTSTHEGIGI